MYSYVTSILADVKHNCQPVPIVLCSTGSVGRSRFEISNCQLEYFFAYKLTCKDIAKVLGVGATTTKIKATPRILKYFDSDGHF